MTYELAVTAEAETDIVAAFTWYQQKRIGLGHDFLLQVDASFRLLQRNPFICSEKYAGVRCHLIKRFPDKVFYHIETNDVIILGVISSRRDPNWIKKKIVS